MASPKAGMRQVVTLLEPELHIAFKVAVAEAGTTMQDVLSAAAATYSADTVARLKQRASRKTTR